MVKHMVKTKRKKDQQMHRNNQRKRVSHHKQKSERNFSKDYTSEIFLSLVKKCSFKGMGGPFWSPTNTVVFTPHSSYTNTAPRQLPSTSNQDGTVKTALYKSYRERQNHILHKQISCKNISTIVRFLSNFSAYVVKHVVKRLFCPFGFRTETNRYTKNHLKSQDFRWFFSRSNGIRTHGLLVPNQARYQLRYAPQ